MIRFLTDPHIGRVAHSHTTQGSRQRLADAILGQALDAAASTPHPVICLGDVFHKSHNSEAVIAQGMDLVGYCTKALAGNHDLPNREGVSSSIQLIADIPGLDDRVVIAPLHAAYIERHRIAGLDIAFVPHQGNQELFNQAIDQACERDGDIVCLHCNVDSTFASDDASLNLSDYQIERLLDHYRYVLVGHEHNSRRERDGRLIILGNLHPTGFSDVSDKGYWEYEQDNDEWTFTRIWKKADMYVNVDIRDFIGGRVDLEGKQFVEVVGECHGSTDARELAKAMIAAWKQYGDSLYMLRNATVMVNDFAPDHDNDSGFDSLIDQIDDYMGKSNMAPLWKHYRGAYK